MLLLLIGSSGWSARAAVASQIKSSMKPLLLLLLGRSIVGFVISTATSTLLTIVTHGTSTIATTTAIAATTTTSSIASESRHCVLLCDLCGIGVVQSESQREKQGLLQISEINQSSCAWQTYLCVSECLQCAVWLGVCAAIGRVRETRCPTNWRIQRAADGVELELEKSDAD